MKLTITVDTSKLEKDINDKLVDGEGLISELTLKGEAECKKKPLKIQETLCVVLLPV